jgi:hypothetical protein
MSFTLMLATTGLSISKHYCGNSLVRTTLGTEAKSCLMDMEMGHGCCDDETETLVVEDDFQASHSKFELAPEYELLVAYLETALASTNGKSLAQPLIPTNTGPPLGSEPLYVKVQSFLL